MFAFLGPVGAAIRNPLRRRRREPEQVVLTADQVEAIGAELDQMRADVIDSLGQADRDYIYSVLTAQRRLEITGRVLMYAPLLPPVWLAGVGALSLSKILDNMEIGHNVMHGQYDWMREPELSGREFEWDNVCPSDQWRHSHNYMHHTFTNIVGKDRDIGYGILRMDPDQKWYPHHLANPLWAGGLSLLFQWGVMMHDMEIENLLTGRRDLAELGPLARGWWRKAGPQVLKDYVLFPALTGPFFATTVIGNAAANLARNIWSFTIIFCGHFPAGTVTFDAEETAEETRAEWYVRQLLGSANITGGRLFHILSGNLSHQIEHHLFPELPACRYPELAPRVQELCERYDLPYNTGGLTRQITSVWRKIFRFALPNSLVGRPVETTVSIERSVAAEAA